MNKLFKGWIPTAFLAATLLFGSTVANASDGIIYGRADKQAGCTADSTEKTNSGIIYGLTGIIYGLTGIIYGEAGGSSDCSTGIIVTD